MLRVAETLAVVAAIVVTAVVIGGRGAPGHAFELRRVADVAARKPPVVMIVFDEFPVDTLRAADGKIDALRYPNFAALAANSTWFRNAHTVYDSTPNYKALPAIMDAKRPPLRGRPGRAPARAAWP